MDMTFEIFHKRITSGHSSPDESWRNEVGYRPDDKDGGFKRWLELTGNIESNHIQEFRRAVYGDNSLDEYGPVQLTIF